MKKVNSILKGLLVVVLLTGTSVVLNTAGVKTINEAQASVSEQEVIDYLTEYGYQVLAAWPKPNSVSDWVCHTVLNGQHYFTVVYVTGSQISGHENMPM